jgi:hypothetical protein
MTGQHVTWKGCRADRKTSEMQNNASDKAIKNEGLIWNKGAWFSLLASIED